MNSFLRILYFALALSSCGYLAAANLRGWSMLQPFAPKPSLFHGTPVRHK